MKNIQGLGKIKLKKYGRPFFQAIKSFRSRYFRDCDEIVTEDELKQLGFIAGAILHEKRRGCDSIGTSEDEISDASPRRDSKPHNHSGIPTITMQGASSLSRENTIHGQSRKVFRSSSAQFSRVPEKSMAPSINVVSRADNVDGPSKKSRKSVTYIQ